MDEAITSAAPTAAVIEPARASTPEIGSQAPTKPVEQQRAERVEKSSIDAVKRASEAVKAREAEKAKEATKVPAKVEAKPAAAAESKVDAKAEPKSEDRGRAPDGKFAAKESPLQGDDRAVQAKTEGDQTSEGRKPHNEPPARFNEIAKKDWATAPDSVREETYRAIKEMEDGHTKYKAEATRYNDFKEYDETAKSNGRDLKESIGKVVEFEKMMKADPIAAMEFVLREAGPRKQDGTPLSMMDVVKHISGQNPDQRVQAVHAENQKLRAEISRMQQETEAPKIVEKFLSDNPDAADYVDDIAFVLKNGNIPSGKLEDALEFVKRFKPNAASNAASSQSSISTQSAQAQTPAPAEIPLNPAGKKSVSGSPGGIDPASQRPAPKSTREALARAAARLG